MSPLIEITDPRVFDPEVILIDVRAGADARQRYLAGHLPNAVFASLDEDLASKPADAAYGGRHPLPALADFAATLGRWGVTPNSHVIVYDDKAAAMGGARLWWMLRAIGHQHVQVLNGGLKAATDHGITLSTDDYQPQPAPAYPVPAAYNGTADIDEVAAAVKSADRIVIDVREEARYLGKTEPLDLIAGHIPGAANLFYAGNMGADGKYLPPEQLAALYQGAIGDVKPENVIVHCGSGVTACHTLLGMASAGITAPKLYVGSWSEWSRRDLPIAGEE
ncbi:sulfurtransferase [Chitinophaga japonensis]|uniref:Thiosulfate/3-mercaptopyruvate sulfurtransferase n=1 Tax=Chitinophaga japonensis TaxID=104662 RepID=A0A562T4T5_CHIJA|nr:sulfurtransferase [Chitinophaga japonensis]TWI88254.1 thiosulfate/3-mercaptopyruvate sulfurtransferase [Chitinophaga japonensis]